MDEVHQLLDLIPKGKRDWLSVKTKEEERMCSSEEKKLELRLGPPGEDWTTIKTDKNNNSLIKQRDDSSLLSLGYLSNINQTQTPSGSNRGFLETRKNEDNTWINGNQINKFSCSSVWSSPSSSQYQQSLPPAMGKELLQKQQQQQSCYSAGKTAFSIPSGSNTAVPNSSQKRNAPAPVVGWPPIRSFRKNLASSTSSKLPVKPEEKSVVPSDKQVVENCPKGLFVKINMDGIPIGRKVDLKAYDSYSKLSCAVDELFRDLLAAQNDSSDGKTQKNQQGEKAITGLLDESGEYTLVYEDYDGDRVLVGDVPWHMFVSSVKRLRVLKSSELSSLNLGSKQDKRNR